MSSRTPVPLTAVLVGPDSPEFRAIRDWPYSEPFVSRLLREDIPKRMLFGWGQCWVYRDPNQRLVGFGTLDVCDDYRDYSSGLYHVYLPLLAINPTIPSLGFGTSIVTHLIDEAATIALRPGCHNVFFLDVYSHNARAIRVYESCGFRKLSSKPMLDPHENNKPYDVMGRRISITQQ
jgi:ribosomal protein S18 acetylase RimI-like enzyme